MIKKKIVFIHSPADTIRWQSLLSITLAIQRFWVRFAKEYKGTIDFLEINLEALDGSISLIREADLFVFPWNGVEFLFRLRSKFGLRGGAIIYLHGESTRAYNCSIGRLSFLLESDTFICASSAEKKSLRLCLRNIQVGICPYPFGLEHDLKRTCSIASPIRKIRMIYAGRISEQKNLHTLFLALKIFCDRKPEYSIQLEIYGDEDYQGSPNMNLPSQGYHAYLKTLVRYLHLESKVIWRGAFPRDLLREIIQSTPHVFVTASLNSDETFGLSAFDSLLWGNFCVLSRWGGHIDLAIHFDNLVKAVPVKETSLGPVLCPIEFSCQMEIAVKDFLKQDMKCGTVPLPSYYSYKIMKKGLLLAIERTDGTGALVKPTEWITSVQSQALKYGVPLGSDSQSFQVYEHYGDPLALRSFRMYGMRKCTKRVEKGGLGLGVLFPWVRFERDLVWVEEPHRGTWELSLSLEEPRTVMVKTFEKSTFWIQPSVYRWLWDRGFLFEDFSELG